MGTPLGRPEALTPPGSRIAGRVAQHRRPPRLARRVEARRRGGHHGSVARTGLARSEQPTEIRAVILRGCAWRGHTRSRKEPRSAFRPSRERPTEPPAQGFGPQGARAPRAAHGGLGRKVVHDGGWYGPSAASGPVGHTTSTKCPSSPFWRPPAGPHRRTVRRTRTKSRPARSCAVLARQSACWSPASRCALARHARARSWAVVRNLGRQKSLF